MGSLQVGAPGDCVATDYLGPLPVTDRGNMYILVFTDHFSKIVEVIPVSDKTADLCAEKLLNEVISRWATPILFTVIGGEHMRVGFFGSSAGC